jgi:transposase
MPAKRKLTMRQLRQMLRLARDGASSREIARVLGVARSTVQENLKRAADAGLSWPLPGELTDHALEQRLFERAGVKQGTRRRAEPNWAELVIDLKKPGVTMMVLWEEYRATRPDGYGYSRFCELFRGFERRLSPSMRQDHVAGDKVFVDYSGKKIAIVDPHTGEIRAAEIFVAVLGASNFTYAEATWTQSLPDWIGAHVRMFRFFGGVPRLVVPDNLKAGVHKASFYDPELNRSYGMMASHYGVGVLPARPRRPKDKAPRAPAGARSCGGGAFAAAAAGRERRPLRPDLHPRPPAARDLLLARRRQPGHRRCPRPHQRSCRPPPRRHPPAPLRDHGAPGPGTPAG